LKDAKLKSFLNRQNYLIADDGAHLKALRECHHAVSAAGFAECRAGRTCNSSSDPAGEDQAGPEGNSCKEIIQAIKFRGQSPKPVTGPANSCVTGKKKDDLQVVIQFGAIDFGVATNFKNFRD
jgi:hypothetical protein